MHFKIDCASLTVEGKFTVFALFYFVFEGNFPSTSPWGAYIWRGNLTEAFCVSGLGGLYLEGLIFGILRCSLLSSFRKSLAMDLPRHLTFGGKTR